MLRVSIYLFFMFGRGSLTYVCFTNSDSSDERTLSVRSLFSNNYVNVTVENCLNECDKLGGYDYAGVEFGHECCTCRLFDELSSPYQTPLLRV